MIPSYAVVDPDGQVLLKSNVPITRLASGQRLSYQGTMFRTGRPGYYAHWRGSDAAEGWICPVTGETLYVLVVGNDLDAVYAMIRVMRGFLGEQDIAPSLPGLPQLASFVERVRFIAEYIFFGKKS